MANKFTSPWSQEQMQMLVTMWGNGVTASRIGVATGKGKSAVIGKAARLGLQPRPNPTKPAVAPAPREPVRTWAAVGIDSNNKRSEIPIRKHEPLKLSKTKTCQYIAVEKARYTDADKCGKPSVEGKPWCPECTEIVFPKPGSKKWLHAARSISAAARDNGRSVGEGKANAMAVGV